MIRRFMLPMAGLFLVAAGGLGALFWFTFRVYVPEDMCAVLIRKSGTPLPAGQMVATEPGQRGIQENVLGPGRYFYNPVMWDFELKPLTVIPAGDPSTWNWAQSSTAEEDARLRKQSAPFGGQLPQIGVVTRRIGKSSAAGEVIVKRDSGVQGILEEVLTPGTYKINPYVFDVQINPAVVIPAGFVGVVTNLFGTSPKSNGAGETDVDFTSLTDRPVDSQAELAAGGDESEQIPRPLAEPGQRGTVRDVLQPGVYFINPKLQKITLVEIGFNEYSQAKSSGSGDHRISFPSDTGYLINVEITVIWGVHPKHAAEIINQFGNIDGVLDKIIGPQLRSICRNIGSNYAARDFIQGEKRELFQKALTAELQRICRRKNIEVLIALVRDIEVHAPDAGPSGGAVTEDLKRTIQQSYLANESQITKDKQREAAAVRAQLEEERKKVEIARETIHAETGVRVANVLADAEKQAAEVDAQAMLEVATIQQEVAQLAAKRTEIMGKAKADVERMKNDAEAKGYEMLIGAFGGGEAYNLFTFAENFKPQSIQLFFAGDGTFWTDLSRLQDIGAAKLLQPSAESTNDANGR